MKAINETDSEPTRTFHVDAAEVLSGLRSSIANVLATAQNVRKPADLQRSFKLDWTLSWQLFQIAGIGGGREPGAIGRGANVPSRTSLKKFLTAAASRGVEPAKVDRVWTEYEQFERLVDVHAGDRTSFNSMVSAAGSLDEDWLATNAQHLRNAYRAMSHVTGLQAKAKVICGIYNNATIADRWDVGVLVGHVGLRMLRIAETIQVFRLRLVEPNVRSVAYREPLGLSRAGGGYLLERFASQPMPAFRMKELDAGWIVGELAQPAVGNLGASTMHFGTVYRNHPAPGVEDTDIGFNADVVADKPVEVIINDSLVRPGLMRGAKPFAQMFLGNNHSDAGVLPGDVIPLLGTYRAEFLGKGPDALASPDVPDYPDMVQAAADKLEWDVSQHEAWRLRIEFPVYQSTVRVRWQLS